MKTTQKDIFFAKFGVILFCFFLIDSFTYLYFYSFWKSFAVLEISCLIAFISYGLLIKTSHFFLIPKIKKQIVIILLLFATRLIFDFLYFRNILACSFCHFFSLTLTIIAISLCLTVVIPMRKHE
jgi:hypothetical protein